jgi:hypothetical protein
LRNFTLFFHTSIAPRLPFQEVLEKVKEQFKAGLDGQILQESLDSKVSLENNIALRICPLMLKNVAIRVGAGWQGAKTRTFTISNVGKVSLPKALEGLVLDFGATVPVGSEATHCLGVLSFNSTTTLSFSRNIRETELEKNFFSFLASQGIDLEIESNAVEPAHKFNIADFFSEISSDALYLLARLRQKIWA